MTSIKHNDFQPADLARTLVIIPCSAEKLEGGTSGPYDPSFASLSNSEGQALREARIKLGAVPEHNHPVLPAWCRYNGHFYRAKGVRKALQYGSLEQHNDDKPHVLILSGGYGIILREEPIAPYNQILNPLHWPNNVLQACLCSYVQHFGLKCVRVFAGRTTPYASVVRPTRRRPNMWAETEVKDAQLLYPVGHKGGAQVIVPRALGEAFAALMNGELHKTWTSPTDKLSLHGEILIR